MTKRIEIEAGSVNEPALFRAIACAANEAAFEGWRFVAAVIKHEHTPLRVIEFGLVWTVASYLEITFDREESAALQSPATPGERKPDTGS